MGVDPLTGNIARKIFVGSEPNKIAISDDGMQLFAGLDGAGAVRQVNLTAGVAGQQFSLGGGAGLYNPPFTATALAVLPGEPNSVAVFPTSGILTIFDSGVARSKTSAGMINTYFDSNYGLLSFGPSASTLYASIGPFQGIEKFALDATGVTAGTNLTSTVLFGNGSLQYDNGRLYLSNGTVLDGNTGVQLGTFSVANNQTVSGPVVSDSSLGLAFIASQGIQSSAQVFAFNEGNFMPAGSINIGGVDTNGSFGVRKIVRWGQDGVAVSTGSQLYVSQSSVVKDLSSSPADLSVSLSAPASANTGSAISYTATIKNLGANQAQGVAFTAALTNTVIINTVSASTGACSSGSEVVCNLGNLTSGSSATVTINLTPTVSGTIRGSGAVSAVSFDPVSSNNQALATTTVSGGLYSAVPTLAGISPALVQAGSTAFTLSLTGSGFNSSSTVNLNGMALPTTYVSNTQLTANVSPSLVANYGWAPVTVSNPSPGGGTSQVVPLTIYALVNISANGISLDPYSGKIYMTLPSTSATLGNSVAALDPQTLSVGTPVSVGSEPNVMAETADGNFLYVGLSGANSLAQFNLITQSLVATFPLSANVFGSSGSVAANGLSVMPGSDTTLAIDVSNLGQIGIFDITGNTGAFRQKFTGIYDGNFPTFADASHFYAYDNYTSGAQFFR